MSFHVCLCALLLLLFLVLACYFFLLLSILVVSSHFPWGNSLRYKMKMHFFRQSLYLFLPGTLGALSVGSTLHQIHGFDFFFFGLNHENLSSKYGHELACNNSYQRLFLFLSFSPSVLSTKALQFGWSWTLSSVLSTLQSCGNWSSGVPFSANSFTVEMASVLHLSLCISTSS